MRNKLILLCALIFGVITTLLLFSYLNNVKASADNVNYMEIVVAKQGITPKTVITTSMVELKQIPAAYGQGQEIREIQEVVGKVALIPINEGQSILENQVIKRGDHQEGLAYMIPEGKRAMSIAINEVSGVSGLVKVKDRVDIITTIDIEDDDDDSVAYTLVVLQDIEVLAVGRVMDSHVDPNAAPEGPKTITLAVALDEALSLKSASYQGNLSLLLRSPMDPSKSQPIPFQVEDFLK